MISRIKRRFRILIKNPYRLYSKNIELKSLFADHDQAVVLGSASSINKLDLTVFSKDMVISVGNFFEHPEINSIRPKIHIFAASHPPITNEVLTNWWNRCNSLLPSDVPILVEKRDREVADKAFKNRNVFFYSYGGDLPVDFTKPILSPWSVTIVALQLAIYCKIPIIGIFGVNHDWQCLKPYTHFYSHDKPSLEYYLDKEGIEIAYEKQKHPFPKERLYKEYELYQQYELVKKVAEENQLKIFNFDPFSDFDVFDFDRKTALIVQE